MEFLKTGLKSVLGAPNHEKQLSGSETIERLVDRVLSSTLLDDRRDACRALKALSKTYRIEVGALGMDALKQILDMDKTDSEIIGLVLDTLCNITNPECYEEEALKYGPNHLIGGQFTEILIKTQSSVAQILRFLDEFDFKVRWPALKLLSNLLKNKPKDIQEIILVSPMGVSKLMDMLSDSREIIRNDALLLLIQMTKGNINIQKIVAFENAFDRIYDVITQEGGVEGGIIVEDCLLLMVNLLRGNYSNQNFFKEGSYIQKLTPMFQLTSNYNETNSLEWTAQKISNVHCLIQVCRTLVAPSGHAQSVSACQKIMKTCGLLQALCDILMISGVPADILTEIINAVAEVIRGNTFNQEFFANFMAPSIPPRPAIVVLLMSMVNEKQPFLLRCSVFYCFQCFLYKNEARQLQLVQTLLPQGKENTILTTGQLLCGGLFASDSLSNWFSSVALSHALIDNSNQKEMLLRVLLAINLGTSPVTMMHQCVILLQQSNKIQSKLGLLILLCRWTSYDPLVVKNFLSIDSSISYLIALLSSHESNDDLQEILLQNMCAFLIGICVHFNDNTVLIYTKDKLCRLIENRIGLENFQNKIGSITKHEVYSRTLKHPQSSAETSSDVLLDHEFCRLLKVLEGTVLKSVLDDCSSHCEKQTIQSIPSDSGLIEHYKELIREQDSKIQILNKSLNIRTKEKEECENRIVESQYQLESLTDQIKILRAAQVSYTEEKSVKSVFTCNESTNNELTEYKKQIHELENRLSESTMTIKELQNRILENKASIKLENELNAQSLELNKIKKDQEDLLELLMDQDNKLVKYKKMLNALGKKVDSEDSCEE